jgi:hypothetical protein
LVSLSTIAKISNVDESTLEEFLVKYSTIWDLIGIIHRKERWGDRERSQFGIQSIEHDPK